MKFEEIKGKEKKIYGRDEQSLARGGSLFYLFSVLLCFGSVSSLLPVDSLRLESGGLGFFVACHHSITGMLLRMAMSPRNATAKAMRKMQVPAYWPASPGVQAVEKRDVDVDSKKVITMDEVGMVMLS